MGDESKRRIGDIDTTAIKEPRSILSFGGPLRFLFWYRET